MSRNPTPFKHNKHKGRKLQRFSDVPTLEQRILNESPKPGDYFYDYKLQEAQKEATLLDESKFHQKYKINFTDLPISGLAQRGLTNKGFTKMTEVQRCVVPHALVGRDVMAASRTGSGKTLAYLVPLIQKLYRNKFMPIDGLGAIVLVPVRELAMQVFEVLNSFSNHMEISVGLVIGGKDIKYEQEKIGLMNILVCTPGRLLQHLEETYGLETNNLQMLVIDEADVMLEMGFRKTLESILENLPKCQTLFFSATLNNEIHKLSEKCMKDPQRIFLHAIRQSHKGKGEKQEKQGQTKSESLTKAEGQSKSFDNLYETPAKLMQYYMVVKSEEKLNVLYSFLKTHHKQKVVVFVSTCKQARFIYEAFRKFKLGSPLYQLQGHQKQKKRMAIYFTFCEKKYGILVCTNIASRGLDFPMVDWVIQLDIPEDVETYVHRAGRTARFKYEGKALTFVGEQEQQFVKNLKDKNIRIHKIIQNPEKYFKIESSLQSICSQHQDVKYLAQRALISYMQFIFKSNNKNIFDIKKLNVEALAKSFGLQNAPHISIQQKDQDESEDQEKNALKKMTKIERLRLKAKLGRQKKKQMRQQQVQQRDEVIIKERPKRSQEQEQGESERAQQSEVSEEDSSNQRFQQEQKDSQEDESQSQEFLKVKRKVKLDQNSKPILVVSKNQLKKIKPEGHFEGKNKVIFDDNLNQISYDEHRLQNLKTANQKNLKSDVQFTYKVQNRLQNNRLVDEEEEKKRRKDKRRKINQQKEQLKRGHSSSARNAVLEEEDFSEQDSN